jgi:hypothetical protein
VTLGLGYFGKNLALDGTFDRATLIYEDLAPYKAIKSKANWFKTVKLHNTFIRLAIWL